MCVFDRELERQVMDGTLKLGEITNIDSKTTRWYWRPDDVAAKHHVAQVWRAVINLLEENAEEQRRLLAVACCR